MMASLIHSNRLTEPSFDASGSSDLLARKKVKQQVLTSTILPNNKNKVPSIDPAHHSGPSLTLIVAPVSLLGQWHSELDRSSIKGTLNVTLWHGSSRGALAVDSSVDVIITSYGTLSSEHAKFLKQGNSALYDGEGSPRQTLL
jgi:DNA repair protein RAD5